MTVRRVALGWRNSSPQAALAFFPPEPLSQAEAALFSGLHPDGSPGSLARRAFVIRAPASAHIRMIRQPGRPPRFDLVPEPGGMSQAAFRGLVTPIVPNAQRNPQTPACQFSLNLFFLSDEDCSIQLMPPFHWPGFRKWPGSIICGRFPVRSWPRPLNCVLEWQDPERDWIIRRGDPMAVVVALYPDQTMEPDLFEAKLTPALKRHLARIDNVSDMGRNVGPMFAEAERRRPARLLEPKISRG